MNSNLKACFVGTALFGASLLIGCVDSGTTNRILEENNKTLQEMQKSFDQRAMEMTQVMSKMATSIDTKLDQAFTSVDQMTAIMKDFVGAFNPQQIQEAFATFEKISSKVLDFMGDGKGSPLASLQSLGEFIPTGLMLVAKAQQSLDLMNPNQSSIATDRIVEMTRMLSEQAGDAKELTEKKIKEVQDFMKDDGKDPKVIQLATKLEKDLQNLQISFGQVETMNENIKGMSDQMVITNNNILCMSLYVDYNNFLVKCHTIELFTANHPSWGLANAKFPNECWDLIKGTKTARTMPPKCPELKK